MKKVLSVVVVGLVCLSSTVAFGEYIFTFSSPTPVLDPMVDDLTNVQVDFVISGVGSAYDGVQTTIVEVDGAEDFMGNMGSTASITSLSAGILDPSIVTQTPPTYAAGILPFGSNTSALGTLFSLTVDASAGQPGEVFTLTPSATILALGGQNVKPDPVELPGTFAIIPEPSGLLIVCAGLGMMALRRRRTM